MSAITDLPRVATIATMPSRLETFQEVFHAIRAQVDHVFVYLDGYAEPPAFLAGLDRITVRRAEQIGNIHSSSRFLCLGELNIPAVVVCADDDIIYPSDYVAVLANLLDVLDGNALVGVHGRIYVPPHLSYVNDAICYHFADRLDLNIHVHEVGCGTCAFVSDRLTVDPLKWDVHGMDDLNMAIEAQGRGIPRVAVARPEGWLRPYTESQDDSLWSKKVKNDTEQSWRMRALLARYTGQD
jgi:hypothetical protein